MEALDKLESQLLETLMSMRLLRERLLHCARLYTQYLATPSSDVNVDVSSLDPLKDKAVNALDLIARYSALTICNPHTFGADAPEGKEEEGGKILANCLLVSSSKILSNASTPSSVFSDNALLPLGMLAHILAYCTTGEENESALIDSFFKHLHERSLQTSLASEDHNACLEIMIEITNVAALRKIMIKHPLFFNLVRERDTGTLLTGNILENETLLGPLFKLSTLVDNAEVRKRYFTDITDESVVSVVTSLRSDLRASRNYMYNFITSLISPKSSDSQAREAVLSWIS